MDVFHRVYYQIPEEPRRSFCIAVDYNHQADKSHLGLWNLIWPHAIGGCHMGRPSDRYMREAGPWAKIELETNIQEESGGLFPRVWGRLVKEIVSHIPRVEP